MSYDLYITPGAELSAGTFSKYFADRAWYTINQLDDGSLQVWYENEDTGTYFSFDWYEDVSSSDDTGEDEEEINAPIAFNMNYFRPHVFGLEAVSEVADFIEHFQCNVADPQIGGIEAGARFTSEEFLNGWNKGNRFGYQAILRAETENDEQQNSGVTPHQRCQNMLASNGCLLATGAEIEAAWHWNLARRQIQAEVTESFFVPGICWMKDKGSDHTHRTIAWGSEVPILVPANATHVVVVLPCSRSGSMWSRLVRQSKVSTDDVDYLFVDLNLIRSADVGQAWSWQGHNGLVIDYGPEALPEALLSNLRATYHVADLRERLAFYPGDSVRNSEIVDDVVES